MSAPRRSRNSDAEKPKAVTFRVTGHGVTCLYSMPWSDAVIPEFGLKAYMLDGARLLIDEAQIERNATRAQVAASWEK